MGLFRSFWLISLHNSASNSRIFVGQSLRRFMSDAPNSTFELFSDSIFRLNLRTWHLNRGLPHFSVNIFAILLLDSFGFFCLNSNTSIFSATVKLFLRRGFDATRKCWYRFSRRKLFVRFGLSMSCSQFSGKKSVPCCSGELITVGSNAYR